MILRNIKSLECPICGCSTIIKEEIDVFCGKVSVHCNGQRWERRTFLCGQEINWIPNFEREEIHKYNICTFNDAYKDKQRKILASKKAVKDFIDTLDIDEIRRSSWKGSIY